MKGVIFKKLYKDGNHSIYTKDKYYHGKIKHEIENGYGQQQTKTSIRKGNFKNGLLNGKGYMKKKREI